MKLKKLKKSDPMQLKLSLSFTNPTPAVLENLATLLEVAEASTVEGQGRVMHADGRASDKCNTHIKVQDEVLRCRIRQLAGCTAIALGKKWCEVWVLAYHEFFSVTGRHPVVESGKMGLPSHLDYVFTDPSWPGVLTGVLEQMLTSSKTAA